MKTKPIRWNSYQLPKLEHGQLAFVSQINSIFSLFERRQGIRRGLRWTATSTSASVGSFLAYNASGGLRLASDDGTKDRVVGWALNAASQGQDVDVQSFGILSNPVTNLSAGWPNPGSLVYLDDTTDGAVSDTPGPGAVILGVFLDDPDILVLPRLV